MIVQKQIPVQPCPPCVAAWVERASAAPGLRLTDLERRRLIAALLTRPHLILSGPAGAGKRRLASALALAIAQGEPGHVRVIQGHPWWAARTDDVAYYVDLQTEFSTWRLADFLESIMTARRRSPRSQAEGDRGDYVVCVERMSPVEIDFYFGVVTRWLRRSAQDQAGAVPLRLIGTYDSQIPPDLYDPILSVAAVVHLGSGSYRGGQPPLPRQRAREER
ncbi:MAG: hypothetical protein M5U01_37615 [Ardenticatenaceae bacterium]|nr:hypothetical protein [Ardenticatenaceae bacterium]